MNCCSQTPRPTTALTWEDLTRRLARHIASLHHTQPGTHAYRVEIQRWNRELDSLQNDEIAASPTPRAPHPLPRPRQHILSRPRSQARRFTSTPEAYRDR